MGIAVIIILGILAFAIFYGLQVRKQGTEMMESGKIVKRQAEFYSRAELFTLRPVTSEEFNNAASDMSFPVQVSGQTRNVTFTSRNFEARLQMTECTDAYCVYRFLFSHWEGRHGIPDAGDLFTMNELLTDVEKLMLKLDPDTKVKTEEVERKTSHKFF